MLLITSGEFYGMVTTYCVIGLQVTLILLCTFSFLLPLWIECTDWREGVKPTSYQCLIVLKITQPVGNVPVDFQNQVHSCYVTLVINRIIMFPSIATWLSASSVWSDNVFTTSGCRIHPEQTCNKLLTPRAKLMRSLVNRVNSLSDNYTENRFHVLQTLNISVKRYDTN